MQISEVDFTLEEVPRIPLSLLKNIYIFYSPRQVYKMLIVSYIEEILLTKEYMMGHLVGRKMAKIYN